MTCSMPLSGGSPDGSANTSAKSVLTVSSCCDSALCCKRAGAVLDDEEEDDAAQGGDVLSVTDNPAV